VTADTSGTAVSADTAATVGPTDRTLAAAACATEPTGPARCATSTDYTRTAVRTGAASTTPTAGTSGPTAPTHQVVVEAASPTSASGSADLPGSTRRTGTPGPSVTGSARL
jgi:hypothetical protein